MHWLNAIFASKYENINSKYFIVFFWGNVLACGSTHKDDRCALASQVLKILLKSGKKWQQSIEILWKD